MSSSLTWSKVFFLFTISKIFCVGSYCQVSLAEWSKAPDLSSGSREGAWVRTPQLTNEFLVWNTPINKILSRISDNLGWQINSYYWLDGLGVWFALRVREVPGSIPGQAHPLFTFLWLFSPSPEEFPPKKSGEVGDRTPGLLNANQTLYHWATSPYGEFGFIHRFAKIR